jgi:fructokinase
MFLVCGEALMDVFIGGDTLTGMALDAHVGGSPFNVAVGLARLGHPVSFFGAISRGPLGERLVRALRDEGVVTTSIARVDAPTTLSLVGLDAQGVPAYAFYGTGSADRQLGEDALQLLPTGLRAIHVGSFATVVEPIASTVRALVEREREHTLISYDPNVRLGVEPDLDRWRDVVHWMLSRARILKISEEDLGLLRPDVAVHSFIDEALAHGVQLVIVTKGERGAQAATQAANVSVPAVAIRLIDSVGAGDAFQAATLSWLAEQGQLSRDAIAAMREAQLTDMLRFAVAAAALTCSRRGADLPLRQEVVSASALRMPTS